MFEIGNWIRPDEYTRETLGDGFKRIEGFNHTSKEHEVTNFWDWEENAWQDPERYWDDEDSIIEWDEYTPEELIVSIFVEGVK